MADNLKGSLGIPMGDATRYRRRPIVTLIIVGLNIAVYAITSYASFFLEVNDYWVSAGGFVPSLITMPSQWYRAFASMFLHADFFHILFNMYFLYIFGRAVENVLGGLRYLTLYLVSGIAACIFHTAFSFLGGFTAYVIPAIGASGAISGVLGAYLILYPGTSLVMGWFFFLFPIFLRMKAAYYLIFWFATQLIYGYARLAGSTAVFAHAGGFIAGIALLPLLAKKEKISQLKLRTIAIPPYLTFIPRKTVGLGRITKAIVAVLLSSLLSGAAYASVGLTSQGDIKATTIQYTCEGTPYVDYVGVQLPNIESQLASISLDKTRILVSRLYGVQLLYDEAKTNENVSVDNWSIKLQVRVGRQNIPVNLIIDYFKGKYDGDGFLSYGEGKLTTQVIVIYPTKAILNGQISYNFQLSSRTVNLTDVTRYTGFPSLFVAIIAFAVVVKKDKELAVVGEESETFWRRFEPII